MDNMNIKQSSWSWGPTMGRDRVKTESLKGQVLEETEKAKNDLEARLEYNIPLLYQILLLSYLLTLGNVKRQIHSI